MISVKKTTVVLCAIWYHSYNVKNAKNVKNTHGGVLLLVLLLLKVTLPHGCFSLFKIVHMVLNRATHYICSIQAIIWIVSLYHQGIV